MDIKTAANKMQQLVLDAPMWIQTPHTSANGLGRLHIVNLLEKIIDGSVTGEKAHRWLAWSQAAHTAFGGGTLNQMKDVNHRA